MKYILIALSFIALTASGQVTSKAFTATGATTIYQGAADNYPISSLTYSNDFLVDITGAYAVNGGVLTLQTGNGRVEVVTSSFDKGVALGGTAMTLDSTYQLVVDVTIGAGSLKVVREWASQIGTITESGVYVYQFTAVANASLSGRAGIFATQADTYYINYFSLTKVKGNRDVPTRADVGAINNFNTINIGRGSTNNGAVYSGTTPSIAVGLQAKVRPSNSQGTTVFGNYASSEIVTTYDAAATAGDGGVAIGNYAKSASWRATAIGDYSIAGSTSSTAIGNGAYCALVHGVAIGRGAYLPNGKSQLESNVALVGGDLANDFYIANGWGHYFDTPPTSIGISNITTPSSTTKTVHGQDAYDSRASPSSYNIAGGNLRLAAGRGTGTGAPGTVSLSANSVLQANPGQNVKRTLYDFIKVDGQEDGTSATGATLYWNGTTYRVYIGAAASGPGGVGRALYVQ